MCEGQSSTLDRCLDRHAKDYAYLSATPNQLKAFAEAVGQMMRTQPNYSQRDLADYQVPVAIVQSEHDENMPNILLVAFAGIDPPAWSEPFRAAAEAGAIQQRDACFPRQGTFLKEGWCLVSA